MMPLLKTVLSLLDTILTPARWPEMTPELSKEILAWEDPPVSSTPYSKTAGDRTGV